MPKTYTAGGRATAGPAPSPNGATPPRSAGSLKERVGALRNLRPFIIMVWRTSPLLTSSSLLLRLLRALLPVVTLYIGKLIIDDVVFLLQAPDRPTTAAGGWQADV